MCVQTQLISNLTFSELTLSSLQKDDTLERDRETQQQNTCREKRRERHREEGQQENWNRER